MDKIFFLNIIMNIINKIGDSTILPKKYLTMTQIYDLKRKNFFGSAVLISLFSLLSAYTLDFFIKNHKNYFKRCLTN